MVRGIPLPSLQEVEDFLPSQRFPSDHLAVSSSQAAIALAAPAAAAVAAAAAVV